MTLLVKKNRSSLPSLVDNFFNVDNFMMPRLFDLEGDLLNFNGGSMVVPDANIIENSKDFKIDLAAPGLERDDFKVEVDNGVLTISAEKEDEMREENENYKRREFTYNSFSRSFTLPENSLPEKIDAKYDNGVLRITLPKKETTISKPVKKIKVS